MTWDEINHLQLADILALPRKTKMVAGGILAIVLGIVVWFALIVPENAKYAALHNQIQGLKQDIRGKQAIAEDLPAYQSQIVQMNHRFAQFVQQLPNRAQIPSLLESVTLAGKSRGLTFNLFQPLPQVNQKFYAKIPVKIEVIGSYDDLGRFTAAVAALPRIVTLRDMEISPAEKPTGQEKNPKSTIVGQETLSSPSLTLSAIVTTYRYRKDSDAKTGEDK